MCTKALPRRWCLVCGQETSRRGARKPALRWRCVCRLFRAGCSWGQQLQKEGQGRRVLGAGGAAELDRVLTKTSADPSGHSGMWVVHIGVEGWGFVPRC